MSDQAFCGLSNPGATCYMNSLLQTLFMTPEFVTGLFRWTYSPGQHSPKEDCIPFQLQLLFAKLLLREDSYVETSGLTKSFQWNLSETFQQHDVQEFCKILFDAIEQCFKGTPQEKLIQDLYEGVYSDCIDCSCCMQSRTIEDKFLDLSLTVKDPVGHVYNDSVEKALQYYLRIEKLVGDNQYFCEQCNSLQDATKGLRFQRLPYILVLQLKRFDLDVVTLQRKKLNDRVTFQVLLNMNAYMHGPNSPDLNESTESISFEDDEVLPAFRVPQSLEGVETLQVPGHQAIPPDADKPLNPPDLPVLRSLRRQRAQACRERFMRQATKYLEVGPDVYELFSVMIHSGSAMGGHYFAYIKDFDSNQWFAFNDTLVKEIEETEILGAFGLNHDKWSMAYGTNAYLLMYRRVTPGNLNTVELSQIPQYILEEIEAQKQELLRLKREREDWLMQITLEVHYLGTVKKVLIRKDKTLDDLKALVQDTFQIPLNWEDFRLRLYVPTKDLYLDCFTGMETLSLEELKLSSPKALVVETKPPDAEFEVFDPSLITVKVNMWDDAIARDANSTLAMKTRTPHRVLVSSKGFLNELLEKLELLFGIPFWEQVLYKRHRVPGIRMAERIDIEASVNKLLIHSSIFAGTVLYLERKGPVSHWSNEFQADLQRLLIFHNWPDSNAGLAFQHTLVLQQSSTVLELRESLAHVLGNNQFVVRRFSKQGRELKDPADKITSVGLVYGSRVFVELGIPCAPDEVRLDVWYARLNAKGVPDSMAYEFHYLFRLPVSLTCSPDLLVQTLTQHMLQAYPTIAVNTHQFVLRRKILNKLTQLLRRPLHEEGIDDDCQLALCESAVSAGIGSIQDVVVVRKWSPATLELGPPREVVVPQGCTLHDLGRVLAAELDMEETQIVATAILYLEHFSRVDLLREQWVRLHQSQRILTEFPLLLRSRGELVVVKNALEAEREATLAERELFANQKLLGYKARESKIKITIRK